MFEQNITRIFLQLILAALFGGLIGFERKHIGKAAGVRTFALVCMGAALFTILSYQGLSGVGGVDYSRIASQILVGVGFIGAGIIMHYRGRVRGLTTAAGIWISAAIGMAIGFGFYLTSFLATVLVLLILFLLGRVDFDPIVIRQSKKRK